MSTVSRGAGPWNPWEGLGGKVEPAPGRERWAVSRGGRREPSRPSPGGPSAPASAGRTACNVAGAAEAARSAGNGEALGRGWRQGGGRAETSRCVRRVARRLGWHRHQLAVPLPQRARGGRGRRLLQSAPLPVPVRARQGEASWGLGRAAGPGSRRAPRAPQLHLPPQAPSLVYGGHGSHVTSVRFTHDDSHLISLGGKDASIFQWRVLGAGGSGLSPATPSRTPSLSPASSLDV